MIKQVKMLFRVKPRLLENYYEGLVIFSVLISLLWTIFGILALLGWKSWIGITFKGETIFFLTISSLSAAISYWISEEMYKGLHFWTAVSEMIGYMLIYPFVVLPLGFTNSFRLLLKLLSYYQIWKRDYWIPKKKELGERIKEADQKRKRRKELEQKEFKEKFKNWWDETTHEFRRLWYLITKNPIMDDDKK